MNTHNGSYKYCVFKILHYTACVRSGHATVLLIQSQILMYFCVGNDYSPNGMISGEIPAANTNHCQILTAVADSKVEEDEYLLVNLSLKIFKQVDFLPEITRHLFKIIIVDQTIPQNRTSFLHPTLIPTPVLGGKT